MQASECVEEVKGGWGERREEKGREEREGGERGGTDWIMVCVCVQVNYASEERGRESAYQQTGVMEDRTLSGSLCVSTMPVSLLHLPPSSLPLLPSLPRQCLELRSAKVNLSTFLMVCLPCWPKPGESFT